MARVIVLVGGVLLVAAATACGAPEADTSACGDAPDDVVTAISARLDAPGRLRFAQTVASAESGITFVSAELHEPDDEDDVDGELHTWAAAEAASFEAVDGRARDNSSWPDASVDVRADGAISSRACVVEARDSDGEDEDEPGDGGGGNPATNDRCPAGAPAAMCEGGR